LHHAAHRRRPAHGTASWNSLFAGDPLGQAAVHLGADGSDPLTRAFPADIKAQTRLALDNVKALAEAGGASLETALKMTIHMTDMPHEFAAMNEVFREYFPKDPPSRTTVGVAHLARAGLKIEIDMIAVVKDGV